MVRTVQNLNLVYTLDSKIYINLTNLCSNQCVFCIRNTVDSIENRNLWLDSEDYSFEEVKKQFEEIFKNNKDTKEAVFCGFGEPLIKFDMFRKTAKFIKQNYKSVKIRVNTNGQANLINKRNIIPELAELTDEVSISLNGENKEVYNRNSQPSDKENAYAAVNDFIKGCVKAGIKTYATVVSGNVDAPVDIEKCKEISSALGASFRVREWLPKGY